MKKVIVCILVLILCLSAFVACDKTPSVDELALEQAIAMVNNLYKSDSKDQPVVPTPADYTVTNKVVGNEISFDISWSVSIKTEGIAPDAITVGEANDNGEITISVPAPGDFDVEYTLTATITNGVVSGSLSFDRVVPKFKVNTAAEYYAAKDGANLVVDGYVSALLSKSVGGTGTNCIYVQDLNNGGGFYVYGMSQDPVKDLNLKIGYKVRVSGELDIYNGTYEIKDSTIEVLDATAKAVTPIDLTEAFLDEDNDLDSPALAGLQGALVTLKGVTIKDVGDNGYHNFELGGKETYIRISSSTNAIDEDTQDAFIAQFKSLSGHLADVTGIVNIYNGNFYIIPADANTLVDKGLVPKSPKDEVAYEKDLIKVPSTIAYAQEVELATAASAYTDVTIAWELTANPAATLVDGVLTVNPLPYAATELVLKATLASAADDLGAAHSEVVEYKVKVNARVLDTATFVAPAAGTYKLGLVQGKLEDINEVARTFYFTGAMNKYNFATSEYAKDAVDVLVEVIAGEGDAADTYILSFVDANSKKQYINIVQDGDYTNLVFQEAKPEVGFSWDTTGRYFYLAAGDENYYIGTYGTNSTIGCSSTSYITGDKAGDIDVKQFIARLCTVVSLTVDEHKLAADMAGFGLSKLSYDQDFTLPLTAGTNGTVVAWAEKTDASNCIVITGGNVAVTRPEENATVVVEATLTNGTASEKVEYTLTITAEPIVKYAVSFSSNDTTMGTVAAAIKNGDAIESGDEVDETTVIVFTITPAAGYRFANYKVGEAAAVTTITGNSFELTVDAAKNVVVTFERIPNPIVSATFDSALGSVSAAIGEDSYTLGQELPDGVTSVTITVAPKSGAEFFSYQIGEAAAINARKDGIFTFDVPVDGADVDVVINLRTIPTSAQLADELASLELGQSLPGGVYTITGIVKEITSAYSEEYNNVTFTFYVEGKEDIVIEAYRLGGTDAKTVGVGDIVAVTGKFSFYDGYTGDRLQCAQSGGSFEIVDSKADERTVEAAKAALALTTSTFKNGEYTLPGTIEGATITWAPKEASALYTLAGTTLTVTGATDPATTVTILATIASNDVSDTKEFDINLSSVLANYTLTVTEATDDHFAITSLQVGGADSTNGASVVEGSQAVIVITPDVGYYFASYTVNGGEAKTPTDNTITESVNANTTIVVNVVSYPTKTLAEFNALEDNTDAFYIIEGVVLRTTGDAKYGNCYISDGTTEVYIWGTETWGASGFAVGDHVKVLAASSSYNSSNQAVSPQLISKDGALTPAEKIALANQKLALPSTTIAEPLTLPTSVDGATGVTVAWAVKEATPALTIAEGVATPVKLATATNVVLVATLSVEGADSIEKEITVTVPAAPVAGALETQLDFVTNFATYASSWSGYAAGEVSFAQLGNTATYGTVAFSRVSKQSSTINDRPVIAANASTVYVTITLDEAETKDLTNVKFTLAQWSTSKKFTDIHIEYLDPTDGTTWKAASDNIITGGSAAAIASPQEVSSTVTLPDGVRAIRLSVTTTSSSNQQIGITSVDLTLE